MWSFTIEYFLPDVMKPFARILPLSQSECQVHYIFASRKNASFVTEKGRITVRQGYPRFLLAGTGTGVGKTTYSMGLMAAFRRRGLVVQGFKCGPDFIDPSFHQAITGRPGRNLDAWMMDREYVIDHFVRASQNVDISIIEGMMGLFDGKDATHWQGSSAEIAEILHCPVFLVVSIEQMALSAAAVVKGFQQFHPGVRIAGVLLNRAGGEGHAQMVTRAIEKHCDLPVLGWLPINMNWELPERQLGLVPAWESHQWTETLRPLVDVIEKQVDLDGMIQLAKKHATLEWTAPVKHLDQNFDFQPLLAVARDHAFCFYYEDLFDYLESCGIQLTFFQPLKGEVVPKEADGLWIGGGFPEAFLPELAKQEAVKQSIRHCVQAGMPVYAEGGGQFFLAEQVCVDHQCFPMAGVLPGTVYMKKQCFSMGYRVVRSRKDSILLSKGEVARGQEFHYSVIDWKDQQEKAAYEWGDGISEGYVEKNLLSSYIHVHFASNPSMVIRWREKMKAFHLKRLREKNSHKYTEYGRNQIDKRENT